MSPPLASLRAYARSWTRSDLGLARDQARLYLPSIVAVMVFLAALALAAAMVLSGAAQRWTAGLAGTLTIEIAAESDVDRRPPEQRLNAVLEIVRAAPGIIRAEPLGRERIAEMIEPWLGKAGLSPDLPLPQIIDVTLSPGARADTAGLARQLAAAVPGTSIDDHRRWLDGLLRIAHTAVLFAAVVVVLVGIAAAGTVILATRAGLSAHRDAIEILHLMGAQDAYIARQFAREAFVLGAIGGTGGLIMAVLVAIGAGFAVQSIEPMLVPRAGLDATGWLVLASLPMAAAAVATLTARQTVMRALERML